MHDLSEVPWSIIESVTDTDDAVFLWESLYKGVADEHAPIKTKRVKGKQTPWVITRLLEIRRDRDYYRKKLKHLIPSTTGKCTGS